MATELGQAYIQIMPSAKGISGKIKNELEPEAVKAGKSSGSTIASTIKKVIGAAAIGKALSMALTAGGDLQQSLGGVETLFKENADKVKAYAAEAYKTSGVSANEYMESVTSFSASLLQSLGGDTASAAEKAQMAMVDMSDNANKMGTSMESIQDAYRGFSRENYTMLDNLALGYGGTKSEMERLLSDATKLSGVKYDISNLADVYDAVHVIQGELGITGTTALEAEETFTGSFAAMKAAATDFLGNLALGENLQPSLNALATTVSTFLFKNFLPMVLNVFKALPGAVITLIQAAVPNILSALKDMLLSVGGSFGKNFIDYLDGDGIYSAIIYTMEDALGGITEKLPDFLARGVDIVTNIIDGILKEIPFFIRGVGGVIETGIEFIMKNLPTFLSAGKDILLNIANGITERLPYIAESIVQVVSRIIDVIIENLPNILITGGKILLELAAGIIKNLPKIVEVAVTLIAKFVAMLISKLPDVLKAGAQILEAIASGIDSKIQDAVNAANNVMRAIWDKIKEWGNDFREAGKNIVNSIADGIRGAVGKVKNAIGSVTQTVRNYLPFSPAKEGPLKDLNKLNFGGTISESIYNARRPVENAMNDLAGTIHSPLSGLRVAQNYSGTSGTSGSGINQYLTINAPTPLDPSETARKNLQASRQLAMEWGL